MSARADCKSPVRTEASGAGAADPPEDAEPLLGPQVPGEVRMPRERGVDQPPFAAQNKAVVAFLIAIMAASAGTALISIQITEAVALQIKELVFSGAFPELKGWACVCALLASLKAGRRVGPASSALLARAAAGF